MTHQNKSWMHLKINLMKISDDTYQVLAIIWTLLTLYLSLASLNSVPNLNVWDIVGFDKLGHFVFYAIFVVLWCMAKCRKNPKKLNFIIFFTIFFGIFIECLQLYMSKGRLFEFGDVIANTFGVLFGVILFKNLIN